MTYTNHTGPAIVTRGLTRHFTSRKQTVEAVRSLDLEIGQGELVAFLGPNGAGKSTTLRMLTTLIPPTAGTPAGAGPAGVPGQRDVRRAIGYVGQGNGAGHQQRGRDELISQGRAHGLSRRDAHRRADELVDDLDLGAVADRKVSTLSGGQRRRLDIAMGLVHLPRVLFLDEPSTGLDPQNRANLQSIVQRLHAQTGSTIVLTTHYLEEADALASRVVVIAGGRTLAEGSPGEIKARAGLRRIRVEADGELPELSGVERATRVGRVHTLYAADAGAVVERLVACGVALEDLEVTPVTLEEAFLSLTQRPQ
jgi:ABC-2 type transport system ATP-binding protein